MVKIGIDLNNIEFSVSPASASVLPTGESAPEFSLEDLDGNEVRLADQRGQVVLVNFWATWCGPCLQELLNIQQIHEKYQDQGLVVLAISTDHQKSAVRPFVEKNGILSRFCSSTSYQPSMRKKGPFVVSYTSGTPTLQQSSITPQCPPVRALWPMPGCQNNLEMAFVFRITIS